MSYIFAIWLVMTAAFFLGFHTGHDVGYSRGRLETIRWYERRRRSEEPVPEAPASG